MAMIDSPDKNSRALLKQAPDALRYDGQTDDPDEVGGMLRAAMPEGVRVLDVGCGTGSITLIATHGKGNEVIGIEPDPERAKVAASRGLNIFNQTLTADFLSSHGPFDVIVFADVLEHLAAPAEMLELAVSGLKAGGLILASVPNVAHWTVRLKLLFGRFDYTDVGICDSTHLRWFTAKSFLSFFESGGLEIVSLRQTAGVDLAVYHRRPFRRIPPKLRRPIIQTLNKVLPNLIGCQHVIVARKPDTGSAARQSKAPHA